MTTSTSELRSFLCNAAIVALTCATLLACGPVCTRDSTRGCMDVALDANSRSESREAWALACHGGYPHACSILASQLEQSDPLAAFKIVYEGCFTSQPKLDPDEEDEPIEYRVSNLRNYHVHACSFAFRLAAKNRGLADEGAFDVAKRMCETFDSCDALAKAYQQGIGVEQDEAKAQQYRERAADDKAWRKDQREWAKSREKRRREREDAHSEAHSSRALPGVTSGAGNTSSSGGLPELNIGITCPPNQVADGRTCRPRPPPDPKPAPRPRQPEPAPAADPCPGQNCVRVVK